MPFQQGGSFFGMQGTFDYAKYDALIREWVSGYENEAEMIIEDFRDYILWLNPNGTPMTALLALAKKEKATSPYVHWFTQTQPKRYGPITQVFSDALHNIPYPGGGVTDDTLHVHVPEYTARHFREGAHVIFYMVPDPDSQNPDEVDGDPRMYVTARVTQVTINGTNSNISVVLLEDDDNAPANPPIHNAHDLRDANFIMALGSVNPEGSGLPDAITYHPTEYMNYTHIHLDSTSITRTAYQSQTRFSRLGGWQEKLRQMDIEHAKGIERAILFSTRHQSIGQNGKPLRAMQGLVPFIYEAGGLVTDYRFEADPTIAGKTWVDGWYAWFNYVMAYIFEYGDTTERIGWIGQQALMHIQEGVRNAERTAYNIDVKTVAYGMKVMEVFGPFGSLYLKSHPMLTTNPAWTNSMIIYDPTDIVYRPLQDTIDIGPDSLKAHLGMDWYDGLTDGILTEATLEFHHPRKCAVMHGFGFDNRM